MPKLFFTPEQAKVLAQEELDAIDPVREEQRIMLILRLHGYVASRQVIQRTLLTPEDKPLTLARNVIEIDIDTDAALGHLVKMITFHNIRAVDVSENSLIGLRQDQQYSGDWELVREGTE